MGAAKHVGRVGGLAVALGVGAAVLSGTAVAVADDSASSSSAVDQSSTQSRTPSRAPQTSSSADAAGAPASTAGRGPRRAAATVAGSARQQTSDSDVTPVPDIELESTIQQRQPESLTDIQPVVDRTAPQPAAAVRAPAATVAAAPAVPAGASEPVAEIAAATIIGTAPVVEASAPVAAPAAAVAAVPTGAITALDDPLAGSGNGGVPVGTPLDWAVLAFSRRNALSAASTLAVPQPAATTSALLPLIMGPSGVPIPSPAYGETVMNYYITPVTPGPILPQQLVFTPEGLYPITGVKSLPLNTSVDQGLRIISDTLSKVPAGNPVTVFGYSQSAIISSLLQGGYTVDIDGTPTKIAVPTDLQGSINFVLVGNEMNPNGGFLSRFSGRDMPLLTLESLGIPFYGATPGGPIPSNGVEYPTTTYIHEYDGFSDFPRYPINLLSNLNAGLGIVYVHVQYTPTISQEACAKKPFCLTQAQVEASRISGQLPSTSASQKYYFIPTENLPLLQPLREITFLGLGEALADLIQPSLKAIVDFGYADPAHGYTSGTQPNANQLQPFDFLPPADLYPEFFKRFFDGIGQGIQDFIGNFGPNGSVTQAISSFSLPTLGPLGMGTTGGFISSVQNAITAVTNYISGAAAGVYAALLPTADIINALLVELPGYATNLFLYGMQEVFSGNVIQGLSDAFGLPIAATVGLSSTAALVGALAWGQALAAVFPGAVAAA